MKLPKNILDKAVKSGQEFGWKRDDFVDVIDSALSENLAIIGGQVQFKLPDGTCELYWKSYDSNDRLPGENWTDYCLRTHHECYEKFKRIDSNDILIKEGIDSFDFLREKNTNGVDLNVFLIFIIYFKDS
ncbi:hypothetical protein [Mangrovimonas yunxiaonensis]|uniref:hypothetical protein n=1 Tax=Mangrovimonas yunxiaonensis TaxID=1197477 RepID=UPI00103E4B5A|nr:hypothetical protein [Mangrovimonas yunxiaonensis]